MDDYLLSPIEENEYAELKRRELAILQPRKSSAEGIEAKLKFNPSRKAVGIFIKRDEGYSLVVDSSDLRHGEEDYITEVYENLQKQLTRISMRDEEWVEHLEPSQPAAPPVQPESEDNLPF